MTADEAKDFGLIDKVITSREPIEGAARHKAVGSRLRGDDALLQSLCGISATIGCSLDGRRLPTLSAMLSFDGLALCGVAANHCRVF